MPLATGEAKRNL